MNKIINVLIDEGIIKKTDKEIYEYGLFVSMFNILCIVSILLLGYISGNLKFTLWFIIYFVPLRILIGGYHCKSAKQCYITFNIVFACMLILQALFVINESYIIVSVIINVMLCLYVKKDIRKKLILLLLLNGIVIVFYQQCFDSYFFAIMLNFVLILLKETKVSRSLI